MTTASIEKPWLFKPGQSGNPSGRPKGLERRFRDLVDEEELPLFLLGVIRDENEKTRERLEAARIYLDRGWGKAPQAVDLNVDTGRSWLEQRTPEELDAFIAAGRHLLEKTRAKQREAEASGQVWALPERSSS